MCKFTLLVVVILGSSISAFANGASFHFGINGSDIAVFDSTHTNSFEVSETVVIDARKDTVFVEYEITSFEPSSVDINMIFPVQNMGYTCGGIIDFYREGEGSSFLRSLNFNVSINGEPINSEEIDKPNINFEGEYENLISEACSFEKFTATIKPGLNLLKITHRILDVGGESFSSSDWRYIYSIWPAKNWVKKFKTAIWRIYLPKYVEGIGPIARDNEWYQQEFDKYRLTYKVIAPGKRIDYEDYIEFTANDFKPEGVIKIDVSLKSLISMVKSCQDLDNEICLNSAIASTLAVRPYIGDKQKYKEEDLSVIKTGDYIEEWASNKKTLKFLRNEVFARKGYIFKTKEMNEFFLKQPWYVPSANSVRLTDVEKSNVEYIENLEK
jgi:hypothetical protein